MAAGPITAGRPTGVRVELRYQLELFALCGFAIAQPLLDVFGRSPESFVFRGAGRVDVVVFALAVTFVPWLVLGGTAAATRILGPRVRRGVQVGLLAALAGLAGLHVLKQVTDVRGWALALAAVGVGTGFAVAYTAAQAVRQWAGYASVMPLFFLAMFVATSSTSGLVFAGGVGAFEVEGSKLPRHVVFLLLDELPTESLLGSDGLIDRDLFPSFRRFADGATWYRNYTSVNSSTLFAVPAVLTGRYPRDVFPTAGNYPRNLFTLLGDAYAVRASEVVTALCPSSVCTPRSGGASALRKLSSDAIDVWRQQVSLHDSQREIAAGFVEEAGEADRAANEEVDTFKALSEGAAGAPTRLQQFVAGIRADGARSFDFLHLLLPHQPWHFYPSGRQYPYPDREPGQPTFVLSGRWGTEARPAEIGRQRHLLQTQYVDALLGRVMADLRRRGLYDDTLIVVTADHGAAFTPGEEVRPGLESDQFPERTLDQVMWAPLMIKAPHQSRGEKSDANVQSVDLLPTLAKLMGIRVPWKVDGVPAGGRTRDDKAFYASFTLPFERTGLGRRHAIDGKQGLGRMLAGSADRFAHGDDRAWSFYRVGPYASLIGRAADELSTARASDVRVKVDHPDSFASVDPARGSVPGLLLGNVVSEREVTIAVAVNGTVAGVSSTFADNEGPRRFGVLVPDFLFVKGRNDVRLFVVDGAATNATLRPLRVDGLE